MLNRNATRHLLLVASALLLVFILVGYTLRKRADSVGLEPDIVDASQSAPASLSPPPAASSSGGGLRPGPSADATPAGDDDLAGWIPSVRSEDLALTPPANVGGTAASQPASLPQSDVITGLVPASPADAGGSSSMRPPSSSPADAGGLQIPSELLDGSDAPSSSSSSDDSSFLASLPVPGGGSLAPPAASSPPPSSLVPPPAAPSSAQSGSSLAPPPVESSGGSLMPPPSPSGGSSLAPPPASGVGLAPPPGGVASAPMGYDEAEEEEDEILEEWGDEDQEPMGSGLTPPPAGGGIAPPSGPGRRTPPPPANNPVAPQRGSESSSDSLRIYVVRSGDTLSSIAARELGSGTFADNIFLLNRDVIDDPDHLLVGVKIRLPYANPVEIPSGSGGRPTLGLGRTHIVARGDTLSSIAQQYYGSSVGWRFLFEANKHLLPNPNQLSVGMELSIPPYEQ